jgi:uncharacterized protein with PIN domain
VAGFISEWWPASNRNAGRLQFGIGGRIASEFALHPAALNFGDCFAYALAQERACPLLYVGGDFKKTDIVAALPGAN